MHLEKRILVTGGAGFLGSHLCERLLERGADIVCVDNFFTGAKRNIAHFIGAKRFELVRHDVTFSLYIEVDEIYNLGRVGGTKPDSNWPSQLSRVCCKEGKRQADRDSKGSRCLMGQAPFEEPLGLVSVSRPCRDGPRSRRGALDAERQFTPGHNAVSPSARAAGRIPSSRRRVP